MDFLADPDEMTPDERLSELAAILTAASLRLLRGNARPAPSSLFADKVVDVCPDPTPPLREPARRGLTDRERVEATP